MYRNISLTYRIGCTVIVFLLCLCLFSRRAAGQEIPTGTWRTHLTYHNAVAVAAGNGKVYSASGNGLFFLDVESNSLGTLSKLDGLTGTGITALAYHTGLAVLVIGYQDGNIDLLLEDETVNVRSVLNSRFPQKTINHIVFTGNQAYLSTPFGVVRLDLSSYLVRETYAGLGSGGSETPVYSAAIARDTLFLATGEGLLAASLAAGVNRLDFRNWTNLRPAPQGQIRHVATAGQEVYFTVAGLGLFRYSAGQAEPVGNIVGTVNSLSASSSRLAVSQPGRVSVFEGGQAPPTVLEGTNIVRPRQAAFGEGGVIWLADNATGLVNGSTRENYFPSGTFDPSVFRLRYFQGKVLAVSGGYQPMSYQPDGNLAGFYVFENGGWENFTPQENFIGAQRIPLVQDLVDAAYLQSQNKVYLASFQDGLLEWDLASGGFSVLQNPFPPNPDGSRRLSALSAGPDGPLWAAQFGGPVGQPNYFLLGAGGVWQAFQFPFPQARFPLGMIADGAGQQWARLAPEAGGGILVFSQSGSRLLNEGVANGDLPSRNVNSLALDRAGSVWVGTDRGVAEFFDPFSVLQGGNAVLPRFEGRPLLADERVTAIAVDGGNRKWVGTQNGAWLFSPDGTRLLARFTEANSPLLSDRIASIAIHPGTGEVFFATSLGIVSYRAAATEAGPEHGQVKIFPNPVPHGFAGLVTLSGLARDATVKITDISGRLVWETRANGGTAVWNARDYNGNRAKTGVYLVFSASPNGESAFAGKIAVIE